MPLDKEKFRTERSRAGFLYFAFLAGATGQPAAAHLGPHNRHLPSMHDTPASCFSASRIRVDRRGRLEISRGRWAAALPAGVIAADK